MAKQIYIDANGNEIEISGTINNAAILPISASDPTPTAQAINGKQNVLEVSINNNASVTSEISVREYVKWHKYGKLVIVDIGGVSSTTTGRKLNAIYGLPVLRTRPVGVLSSDTDGNFNAVFYGAITTQSMTVYIPHVDTPFYGQVMYITD